MASRDWGCGVIGIRVALEAGRDARRGSAFVGERRFP